MLRNDNENQMDRLDKRRNVGADQGETLPLTSICVHEQIDDGPIRIALSA